MKPNVNEEGFKTINALVSSELERTKPLVGIPEIEAGTRIVGPTKLQVEDELWAFEFIVEYIMAKNPQDENQGFTIDDFTRRDLVAVSRILDEAEGKPKRYQGEIMRLQRFYEEFQTDQISQIKIDRVMDMMDQMVRPSENFFMKINEVWINRIAGENPFQRTIYRC